MKASAVHSGLLVGIWVILCFLLAEVYRIAYVVEQAGGTHAPQGKAE